MIADHFSGCPFLYFNVFQAPGLTGILMPEKPEESEQL